MKSMKNRWRAGYLTAFLILLGVEIVIALYVHDSFIRPYVGDALVMILLYCLIRIIIPDKMKMLPLWLFLLGAATEILQAGHLADRIGLGNNRFFRVLLGTTADWHDILCYGAGCLLLGGWELWKAGREKAKSEKTEADIKRKCRQKKGE